MRRFARSMIYRLAALYAGIGESTLRDWVAKGDAGDEQFAEFVAAVRQAEAEGVLTNLRFINTAMDWRAQAWVLEHRHRGVWCEEHAEAHRRCR